RSEILPGRTGCGHRAPDVAGQGGKRSRRGQQLFGRTAAEPPCRSGDQQSASGVPVGLAAAGGALPPAEPRGNKDTVMNILIWIVVGGLIGWLASKLMNTDGQQGIVLNVVVGIVGALIGGWALSPIFGIATI